MDLTRTSVLGAVAVGTKIASMLAVNKILALLVGPAGYALVGQFQNMMTVCVSVASAGVGTGVTKYTAEFSASESRQGEIWSAAALIGVVGVGVTAVALALFSRPLASALFGDASYQYLPILIAGALPMAVLNVMLLSILNGRKEIVRYVVANVIGSVLVVLCVGIGAASAMLPGALAALAVSQIAACVATIFISVRTGWFSTARFRSPVRRADMTSLLSFTLMAAATSVAGPVCQLAIRNLLMDDFGAAAAGYWEALVRISGTYLMFMSTPLSVYYLPRIAELQHGAAIKKEIVQGFRLLLPASMLAAILIYVFRDLLIQILFSSEFQAMRDLFLWYLVGDVLRAAAWLLSFVLLAKAMVKEFVGCEIACNLSLVALTSLLTSWLGLEGVSVAHATNGAIYLSLLAAIVYRKLSR